jgi:hypothetical protein
MFTDFRNRLTYFGTLDDVVYRYPWPARIDLRSMQHQLIVAAIYDKKILINDGYLITNPQLLGELKDIDRSLVGNLLMTGIARLFARGGKSNLAEGIEKGAGSISTHARIVGDKARWRLMRDDLEFLSSEVEKHTLPWPSDKNMGEMFYRLMARVRGMTAEQRATLLPTFALRDFDAVFDRFDAAIQKPSYQGARSVWESQCWIHFHGCEVSAHAVGEIETVEQRQRAYPCYERVRGLMNVANEVYHLAYAVAAHHALRSGPVFRGIDPASIGVSTSLITAFPDLLGSEDQPDEAGDSAKLRALNQLLITLPARLRFQDDFFFVTRLTTNGDCRRARAAYLDALAAFVAERMSHDDALKARKTYERALIQQLAPGLRHRWFEYLADRMIETASNPAAYALGAAGAALGAGVPVVAAGLAATFLLPIGFDHLNNLLVERLLQARVSAALAQGEVRARQDRHQPSLARQLGLYLGPLKAEGGSRLLAEVARP